MRLGAILGGAARSRKGALGKYGHDLGMAFQIVDDVLDLTASEDVLGKPVASDLREGKATMAVIHALERCTPEERKKIETILQEKAFNGVTHAAHSGDSASATVPLMQLRHGRRNMLSRPAKPSAPSPIREIKRALLWAPSS